MNTRIRELADKARFVDSAAEYPSQDEVFEKFAELIVQECVNVLHDNELWSRDISHVLKEHFGAE